MGVLRFDADAVVTLATPLTVSTGTASWTLEFKVSFSAYPASGNWYITGHGSSTPNEGFCLRQASGDGALALVDNGSNVAGFTSNTGYILNDGALHIYRVERDAGADIRFYRDGSLIQTKSWVTGSAFSINVGRFGRGSGGATGSSALMDLEYFDATSFGSGEKWDANLSSGSGSTLPTVSGSNQGTLVDFTVPDCWIGFSSGAVLESSLTSQSSTTFSLTTEIRLASGLGTVSAVTASLTTGIPLSSSSGSSSSITAELTDSTSGMQANLSSGSSCTFSLTTSVQLSASLISSATLAAVLDGSGPTEQLTYQNKKLILLRDAGEGYQLNTINDAIDTYLEQRYTVSGGLSDLIARYLSEP